MEYLEFEQPIKELQEQLESCKLVGEENGVDVKQACKQIEVAIEESKKRIYSKLTAWQKVQLSRHPSRPYSLDYIYHITENSFIELHGDRNFGDDKAMVGGMGKIKGIPFMIIGQQKGKNTKERQYRRFGMPNPEGYRKALRLMKLAEKFNMPIITLMDTPGAYPGLEAEERGQGEAIAKNIYEMMNLTVPVISIVIGEGASGGALGIGVGNQVFMMENTWYSVISPENCSAILWRSWDYKEQVASQMKMTPNDMLELKIIDGVIKEPLGGAHYDPSEAAENLKSQILKSYQELSKLSGEDLKKQRQDKFIAMGEFSG
ncbi:acetyl-CoA carboxylase carboxyltransferase subunit alpha [Moheibacter lacus]|uniref:Acetyl-coenzyme A carboxylase carboxyl transferase subunit alpha n=1 Tax=Moheibacter lacus TaxID=2745851 RepID=A0A838ZR06_9FLAO|nr:acetyl-CoA carboxylase carboxyltransferase subunit alpha [Moheibacter lacus]MBA5629875.1 acetyl-CoA carboxylase carboxyltransferase subunit alpha [Moheibacter lacus]